MVFVVTFPPSKDLETYLEAYLVEVQSQQGARQDIIGAYCLSKLKEISGKGSRGKAPSLSEIEAASVRASKYISRISLLKATCLFSGRRLPPLAFWVHLGGNHVSAGTGISPGEDPHNSTFSG